MPAGRQLPAVTKNRNYPQPVKHLKPVALGCDVTAVLTKMGAKVGTRASLIGDTSKRRSRYCARFPCHATEVAVVAYVLTRIAPFDHQIRA